MTPPPVAVRFTAEDDGVASAIRDLTQQMRGLGRQADQTDDAVRRSSQGFDRMAATVRRLATSYLVLRAVEFAKDAIDVADAISKLADKTGASAESLSVFAFAARTANVSQEDLETGLIRLSRTLDDANTGSKTAAQSLKRLGLSAADIKTIKVDEAFLRIANAMQKLAPGFQRAALAQQAFGRGGAQLIPLLLDLAGTGMAEAEAKARSLGLVFNDKAAKAAEAFNDSLTDLKSSASGAAGQIATGLIPALTNVLKVLTGDAASAIGTGFFAELGRSIGDLVRNTTADAIRLEAVLETIGARIGLAAANAKALIQAGTGHFAEAAVTGSLGRETFTKSIADIRARRDRDLTALFAPPETKPRSNGSGTSGSGGGSDPLGPALARAQLDAQKAAIARELDLARARNKALQDINQGQFDDGLQSLASYSARRLGLIREASAAEIAALEAQKKVVDGIKPANAVEATKQKTDSENLAAQITQARVKAEQDERAAVAKRSTDEHALEVQRLQAEAKVQEARGNTLALALQAIDTEAAELRKQLTARGVTGAAQNAEVARLTDPLRAKAQFDVLANEVQRTMNALEQERTRITQAVQVGAITELQGQQQIAAAESGRLPTLRQLADLMRAAADTLGNPELQAQVAQLDTQIAGLAASSDLAAQASARFAADLQTAVQNDIAQFLGDTINQVDSLGEAFTSLALSVVQSIQRIVAELIAARLVSGLTRVLGLVGGAAAGGATGGNEAQHAADQGFAFGFAAGGVVPGSGSGDTVPAMLTPGEGVLTRSEMAALGGQTGFAAFRRELGSPDWNLPPIHRGGRQHLATGGLVVDAPAGAQGGSIEAIVGLDEGLVVKHLKSTRGTVALREWARDNRSYLKATIGP